MSSVRSDKQLFRDAFLVMTMLLASFYALLTPEQKNEAGQRINLSSYLPSSFGHWQSVQYDTSEYKDRWQSINELVMRDYTDKIAGMKVTLIVEYSSDLRKNFTFHFPEGCYRAAGQEVSFLAPLTVNLPDQRTLRAKTIYIKGAKEGLSQEDQITSYWLVIDNKQYSQTLFIKLNQLMGGILKRSNKGFLMRIDSPPGVNYSERTIKYVNAMTSKFIIDFYNAMDDKEKTMFFGR